MSEDILFLNEANARNYNALVNFVNGNKVISNAKRPRSGGVKSRKRRDSINRNLLLRQNFVCVDCQYKFVQDAQGYWDFTRDHIIPAVYGSCLNMNIELVCGPCNQNRVGKEVEHIKRYFGLTDSDLEAIKN